MSTHALSIAPLQEADLPALAAFMRAQGQAGADEAHLRHWYLHNPAGSSAVMLARIAERIVGMATTNDHWFSGPEGRVLVAMPQKVLTDASLRGQGIFGRAYQASEAAGRRQGIGFFLTVTNAASTPIFLEKFGYRRLPVPRMLVLPPAFGRIRGHVTEFIAPSEAPDGDRSTWRMEKDEAHVQWRFLAYPGNGHLHRTFRFDDGTGGSVFLKRMKRKGVPLMLVLDLVPSHPDVAPRLLRQARRIAARNGCAAVLVLAEERMVRAAAGMVRATVSSGFNLLVKGLDEAGTQRLLGQRFELAFGDLDFL